MTFVASQSLPEPYRTDTQSGVAEIAFARNAQGLFVRSAAEYPSKREMRAV